MRRSQARQRRVVWGDDDGESRSAIPAEGRAPSEESQTTVARESRKEGTQIRERVFLERLYEGVIFGNEKEDDSYLDFLGRVVWWKKESDSYL